MDITDLISSSKQEASSKQAASKQARAKWGNITPPLWCLEFGQNFGGCYLWVQNLCTLAADTPKPKTDHISGYMAQNAMSSAPNPPATTHFWWFPPLKIALSNTWTPVPRPSGLRQAARGGPQRWVQKWVNKVHRVRKNDFLQK